jgi:hypothetical protein
MKSDTILAALPFDGFYQSSYSIELDDFISYPYDGEFSEATEKAWYNLYTFVNWEKVHEYFAREIYIPSFWTVLKNNIPSDIKVPKNFIQFESIESPQYYNYTTDRLFVYVNKSIIKRLYRYVMQYELEKFEAFVWARHTSCSGFSSYYPNNIRYWKPDPLDWDHNQLQTLFYALIAPDNWQETDRYLPDELCFIEEKSEHLTEMLEIGCDTEKTKTLLEVFQTFLDQDCDTNA